MIPVVLVPSDIYELSVRVDPGLTRIGEDWSRIVHESADWLRREEEVYLLVDLLEWIWIDDGLASDWHQIGTGLAVGWHRIGDGSAQAWHRIGCIDNGLE